MGELHLFFGEMAAGRSTFAAVSRHFHAPAPAEGLGITVHRDGKTVP